MKRLDTLFILMLLLLLGTVSATVIFEDTFSDGDYTSNPTWTLGAGTANVTNGELYFTGFFDTDNRLTTIMGTNINENNVCDFSISYNGALLNNMPQAGRTVNLELTTDLPSRNYGLRIYNGDGFVDSFGNNKEFITFGFGTDNSRDDRVISNISAQFGRSYNLEAKRIAGLWSFYIDNTLIGTTQDDMQCNNLTQLTFFNVGVGKADNLKIVKNDDIKVPEFSFYGIFLIIGGTILFFILKKK